MELPTLAPLTSGAAIAFLPFALFIGGWVAWSDMKLMKIPNKTMIALLAVWLVVGLAAVFLTGFALQSWAWGWVLAAITLVIGFLANALRLVGGGDAKFATAMAPFFVGADWRYVFILAASCLIGAFIVHRIIRRIGFVRRATPDWISWTSRDFPMGLALAGTLIFHILLTIPGAF
ncbi:MAG: prepilin peptidase [Pseudotabrizicola sp.]|uniref:prepilin peptidase n=1 Tax=Pseudotabrizicola sp. TaxID=2939647 RepID=UPI00272568DA|nr:prepilin peptidase [Pseudotabrizicola sp.]MDO9640142.1 prepilin peptidase [Pseudotabrizicola sp.]